METRCLAKGIEKIKLYVRMAQGVKGWGGEYIVSWRVGWVDWGLKGWVGVEELNEDWVGIEWGVRGLSWMRIGGLRASWEVEWGLREWSGLWGGWVVLLGCCKFSYLCCMTYSWLFATLQRSCLHFGMLWVHCFAFKLLIMLNMQTERCRWHYAEDWGN